MTAAAAGLPPEPRAIERPDGKRTIQWNESAAAAALRMRDGGLASLTVMADGEVVGQLRLGDIERCEENGNWLDAVMVLDLVRQPGDTCN